MKILILVQEHNTDDKNFIKYKEIWNKKIDYIKKHDLPIEVIYLNSNPKLDCDYKIIDSTLYSNCVENYWEALLIKVTNGFDYFVKSDFDLVFKTNLSTFINFDKFLDVCNNLDLTREHIYDGFIGDYKGFWFCSGAGMLLNKKSCELILQNKHLISEEWTDDIFFGYVLNSLNNITPNVGRIERFDILYPTEKFNMEHLKNFSHIRVKIRQSDWDSIVFDKLFNLFYQ